MLVQDVFWISNLSKEAEVTVTDGFLKCTAFCYPCNFQVGDSINEPLHVFDIKDIVLSDQQDVGVWKVDESGFRQHVIGYVENAAEQLLTVGEIIMVVDGYLPGWIKDGDLVDFECARIDLW